MPIRFHCQHCHQLLGIARRKAGTAVRCPTCQGRVLVPMSDMTEAAGPARPVEGEVNPLLFERSDFDEVLRGSPEATEPPVVAAAGGRPYTAPPPRSAPEPRAVAAFVPETNGPELHAAPSPPTRTPPGLTLTPTQATVLTVTVILLLALAFGVGLVVGRWVL